MVVGAGVGGAGFEEVFRSLRPVCGDVDDGAGVAGASVLGLGVGAEVIGEAVGAGLVGASVVGLGVGAGEVGKAVGA